MNLYIQQRADLVRVTGRHFFTVAEAQQHFRELAVVLREARRAGKVRVIVDLRESKPQSAEVAGIIRASTSILYRPEDRVAILAASSILKLQLKRIHEGQHFGVFLTETAALEFIGRESDTLAA